MIVVVNSVHPAETLEVPDGTTWLYVCRDGSQHFITHDLVAVGQWMAQPDRYDPLIEPGRIERVESDEADGERV